MKNFCWGILLTLVLIFTIGATAEGGWEDKLTFLTAAQPVVVTVRSTRLGPAAVLGAEIPSAVEWQGIVVQDGVLYTLCLRIPGGDDGPRGIIMKLPLTDKSVAEISREKVGKR